jgi:formylglycine-generating enzyme required for sulfatase activity
LQQLYQPPAGARVSPEARFAYGNILAHQGDHRPGVGVNAQGLPDIDWCTIPAGDFLFGRRLEKRSLPEFKISRYPVTVSQYRVFVAAPDGYARAEWWQELPVTVPRKPRPAFDFANHPVTGVSWCDAIAFCRWLSAKLDCQITLPAEQQWEKAARGTGGQPWPWKGRMYLVGYANVDERDEHNPIGPTYLRSTTAVGLYPWGKSPYGVMDMCGNVWEWCLNDADDQEGLEMGNPHAGKQLRGGSWNNNIDVAPNFHRYTDWMPPLKPTSRNWRFGFRLVLID